MLFGTLVYIALVHVAAAVPVAAGAMLTFPALNGLALLYEDRARANAIAGTMLLMPVVSGLLCVLFIFAYWCWSHQTWADAFAMALAIVVALLWAVVLYLLRRARGVPERRHVWYALACTIIFTAVALVVARSVPSLAAQGLPQGQPEVATVFSVERMRQTAFGNGVRIALFAGALALFVMLSENSSVPPNIRGFFGGFPVVPFGGLLTLALKRPTAFDAHIEMFGAMAAGVWLSPIVPVWFIYGYSRYLSGTSAPFFACFVVLIAAWAACFLSIAGLSQWMLAGVTSP